MNSCKWFIYIYLIFFGGYVVAQGIDFKSGSWKSIKEKALQQDKIIFIDCYTVWCSPCKWMDKNTFSNDSVGLFYNQHFINIKMNMEKGEGLLIKNLYKVEAYPTYLFVDGNGRLIYRSLGACSPKVFIQIGKDALHPKNNIEKWKQIIFDTTNNTKVMDIEVIAALLNHYQNNFQKINTILDYYIPYLQYENWQNSNHYQLLKKYLSNPFSKSFSYLLNNYENLAKTFSADSLDALITKVCRDYYFSPFYYDTIVSLNMMNDLFNKIDSFEVVDKKIVKYYVRLKFVEQNQNIPEFIEIVDFLLQTKERNNFLFIKKSIDYVFENTNDTTWQRKAIMWLQPVLKNYSFDLENHYYYANLLYKAGQKELGIAEMFKIIEMAGKTGIDTKKYSERLIEMMKNRGTN